MRSIPKGKLAVGKRAVLSMLRRLFMKQKVEYLAQLQRVPVEFRKRINALNELRNILAHRSAIERKSGRLYRGKHDLFSKAGLSPFGDEMWEIHQFLTPSITRFASRLVDAQKVRLRG